MRGVLGEGVVWRVAGLRGHFLIGASFPRCYISTVNGVLV